MKDPKDKLKNKQERFNDWVRKNIESLADDVGKNLDSVDSVVKVMVAICRVLNIQPNKIIEYSEQSIENNEYFSKLLNHEKNNKDRALDEFHKKVDKYTKKNKNIKPVNTGKNERLSKKRAE